MIFPAAYTFVTTRCTPNSRFVRKRSEAFRQNKSEVMDFDDLVAVPTHSVHRKPPSSPPTALAQNVEACPRPARTHPECDVDLLAKRARENSNAANGGKSLR